MIATATTTPCAPVADRFRCQIEVPDPPSDPRGRTSYWADTVQEAVAELRRQMRSHDPDRADRALSAIVDVEKARMRHGRPVSGTEVSSTAATARDPHPLPTLAPLDDGPAWPSAKAARIAAVIAGPVPPPADPRPILPSRADPPSPGANRDPQPVTEPPPRSGPIREGPTTAVGGAPPPPPRTPTNTAPASAPSPAPPDDPAFHARLVRERAAFIEATGCYPEDGLPDSVFGRFKSEPRPHPAFLRAQAALGGTRDDTPTPGVVAPNPA